MTTALHSLAANVLADVLTLTANHNTWQDIDRKQAVSVRRVLATAWNPVRLQRAAARLAAGERAPAISVSRYWLAGESWYVVGDGHHRAVAAREAGRRTIRAHINGELLCEPEACYLDIANGRLWRHTANNANGTPVLTIISQTIGDELATALLAAGVGDLAKGVAWRIPT